MGKMDNLWRFRDPTFKPSSGADNAVLDVAAQTVENILLYGLFIHVNDVARAGTGRPAGDGDTGYQSSLAARNFSAT